MLHRILKIIMSIFSVVSSKQNREVSTSEIDELNRNNSLVVGNKTLAQFPAFRVTTVLLLTFSHSAHLFAICKAYVPTFSEKNFISPRMEFDGDNLI